MSLETCTECKCLIPDGYAEHDDFARPYCPDCAAQAKQDVSIWTGDLDPQEND